MFKKIVTAAIMFIASTESYSLNLQAKSWLIADADGKILEYQNVDIIQPIASITKLMTVMVVLDSNPNLQQEIKNFRGLTVTRQQLIDLAVVHSDNKAADLLCKMYNTGYQSCIDAMNIKAQQLGMYQTVFADSTGLDNRNISSPKDLIKLLQAAEKYSIIVNASNRSSIELMKKRKRKFVKWRVNNTNPLVSKYNVIVSKTGYVRASGGCLVMSAYVNGKKKLFVVLNSKTTRTRIHDMESLITSVLAEKN